MTLMASIRRHGLSDRDTSAHDVCAASHTYRLAHPFEHLWHLTCKSSGDFSITKVTSKPSAKRNVVTLADLAPRHSVLGGSGRRVFGAEPSADRDAAVTDRTVGTKSANNLRAKKHPKVSSQK